MLYTFCPQHSPTGLLTLSFAVHIHSVHSTLSQGCLLHALLYTFCPQHPFTGLLTARSAVHMLPAALSQSKRKRLVKWFQTTVPELLCGGIIKYFLKPYGVCLCSRCVLPGKGLDGRGQGDRTSRVLRQAARSEVRAFTNGRFSDRLPNQRCVYRQSCHAHGCGWEFDDSHPPYRPYILHAVSWLWMGTS